MTIGPYAYAHGPRAGRQHRRVDEHRHGGDPWLNRSIDEPPVIRTLAHHFDDLEQQKEAATLGMWLFLATEVMLFGGIFLGLHRLPLPLLRGFAEGSGHLYVSLGHDQYGRPAGSSFLMALAVRAAHHGNCAGHRPLPHPHDDPRRDLPRHQGHRVPHRLPRRDHPLVQLAPRPRPLERQPAHVKLFIVFYFIMTMLHAMHMTVGMCVLAVIAWFAHRGKFTARVLQPRRDRRPVLALRRHRLGLPVPDALPGQPAVPNDGTRILTRCPA